MIHVTSSDSRHVGIIVIALLSWSCGGGASKPLDASAGDATAPCSATLQTIAPPSDGVAFIAVGPDDMVYIAPWSTPNTLYVLDPRTGSGHITFDDHGASPTWGSTMNVAQVVGGSTYLAGNSIVRIAADGSMQVFSTEAVGGFAANSTTAFGTNTNGEIRSFELATPLAASTVFAKQGLDYQNAELFATDTDLIVLGTVDSGSPAASKALYRLPLSGGARVPLFTAPNEYLTGVNVSGDSAFVLATHFNGTIHDGTGRVSLDGSSASAAEWLTDTNALATLGTAGARNRTPVTSDSVILSYVAAGGGVSLVRRVLATGDECPLGTFEANSSPAIVEAAGPHTFAWYGRDKLVHWYALP